MSRQVLRNASLLSLILISTAASAEDDNAVNIVGPTGRSSIAVTDNYSDFNSNQFLRTTGQLNGSIHDTSNTAKLDGLYAVNDRLTIVARLPWTIAGKDTFNWGGATTQNNTYNRVGEGLEISGVLIGDTFGQGYRLVGNIGSARSSQGSPDTYAQLQPMYWFSKELLLSTNIGAGHQNLGGNSSFNHQDVTVNLLWYPTSQLSIMPSIGVVHVNATNTYTGYNDSTIGISSTYHIDNNWTTFANLSWMSRSARTTYYYLNNGGDGRASNIGIGIRRLF